jgi:hypothetical protein
VPYSGAGPDERFRLVAFEAIGLFAVPDPPLLLGAFALYDAMSIFHVVLPS